MKILCLNPGPIKEKTARNDLLVKEGRCMERSGAWSNLRMPITLAYISNILKKDGHEVKLVDDIAMQYMGKGTDMGKLLDEFNPDVLVLNTSVPTVFSEDMDNAELAKKKNPKIKVIVIGVAPTIMDDPILKAGYVDIAIRGEPEGLISALIKNIENKESLNGFEGISFVDNGRFVRNPSNKELVDLDKLPYPDYESLPLDAYRTPVEKKKQVLIESSRGCPHQCIYCAGPQLSETSEQHAP